MNAIVLLSALIMVPSYKTAPVPCETEKRALGVVMWSQAPESSRKRAPKEIKVQTWLADDRKKAKVTVTDEKGQVVKERDIDNPTLWNDEFPAVCVMPI